MNKNQFIIAINEFADLSREVGYANSLANQKNEKGEYSKQAIKKYESLRRKQLEAQKKLIETFGKSTEKPIRVIPNVPISDRTTFKDGRCR